METFYSENANALVIHELLTEKTVIKSVSVIHLHIAYNYLSQTSSVFQSVVKSCCLRGCHKQMATAMRQTFTKVFAKRYTVQLTNSYER